jgi:hypothetical protein
MRRLPSAWGDGRLDRLSNQALLCALQPGGCTQRRAATRGSRKRWGKKQPLLVAIARSGPPAGCARWTLELLADELVRLIERANISCETARRRLTENQLKPWRQKLWGIPQVDGEYAACIEDVLDFYAEAPRCLF